MSLHNMEWIKKVFSSQPTAGKNGERSSSVGMPDQENDDEESIRGRGEGKDGQLGGHDERNDYVDAEERVEGLNGGDHAKTPKEKRKRTKKKKQPKNDRWRQLSQSRELEEQDGAQFEEVQPSQISPSEDVEDAPNSQGAGREGKKTIYSNFSRARKAKEIGGRATQQSGGVEAQEDFGNENIQATMEAAAGSRKPKAAKVRKSKRNKIHQEDPEASQPEKDHSDHEERADSPAKSEHDQDLSIRPSAKALGKRKAVDQPVVELPSKRRRTVGGSETVPSRDIRDMMSLRSEHDHESGSNAFLSEFARKTYLEFASEQSTHTTSDTSPPPPTRSRMGKESSSGGPTSFTPINKPRGEGSASALDADIEPSTSARKKRRLPVPDEESAASKSAKSSSRSSKAKTPGSASRKARVRTASSSASKGALTKQDIELLTDTVKAYMSINDLTQREMNDLVQKDAATVGREFWKHLYDELPNLSRRNLMTMCRRRFHNFKQGPFTEEDDEELKRAYARNPDKWKLIGEEIDRFPEVARDHWRGYVVCGEKLKKDLWDKEEEATLRRVVKQYLARARKAHRYSDDSSVAVASDESLIDWGEISKQMDHTRNRLQCANKWKKLKEREKSEDDDLLAAAPVGTSWRVDEARDFVLGMTPADKLELLHAIRESNAGSESTIPWRRITMQELNTKGRRMAWRLCLRKLKERVPRYEGMKLQEIVTHLIEQFEGADGGEPEDVALVIGPSESRGASGSHGERSAKKKRKRKSNKEKFRSDERVVEDDSDNGEGLSTQISTGSANAIPNNVTALDVTEEAAKLRKSRNSKRKEKKLKTVAAQDEETPAQEDGQSSTARKRKFRDQMQIEDDGQNEHEEGPATTETRLRTKKRKFRSHVKDFSPAPETPAAKAHSRAASRSKRNNVLSEGKAVDDDSEDMEASDSQEEGEEGRSNLGNAEFNVQDERNHSDAGNVEVSGNQDDGEEAIGERAASDSGSIADDDEDVTMHGVQETEKLYVEQDDGDNAENPAAESEDHTDSSDMSPKSASGEGNASEEDTSREVTNESLPPDQESTKDYEETHVETNELDSACEEQDSREDYPGDSQANEDSHSRDDASDQVDDDARTDSDDDDNEASIKSEPSDTEDRIIAMNGFQPTINNPSSPTPSPPVLDEENDDQEDNSTGAFHDTESVDLDDAVDGSRGETSPSVHDDTEDEVEAGVKMSRELKKRGVGAVWEEFERELSGQKELEISSDDEDENIPAVVRREESVDLDAGR